MKSNVYSYTLIYQSNHSVSSGRVHVGTFPVQIDWITIVTLAYTSTEENLLGTQY